MRARTFFFTVICIAPLKQMKGKAIASDNIVDSQDYRCSHILISLPMTIQKPWWKNPHVKLKRIRMATCIHLGIFVAGWCCQGRTDLPDRAQWLSGSLACSWLSTLCGDGLPQPRYRGLQQQLHSKEEAVCVCMCVCMWNIHTQTALEKS